MLFVLEMLRTQAVQKWVEIRQADSVQSKMYGARGNPSNEGPYTELFKSKGGGL